MHLLQLFFTSSVVFLLSLQDYFTMAQPHMSLLRLGQITSNFNDTLQFFRSNGLLKTAKLCLPCKQWNTHVKYRGRIDKYVWRCPSCKTVTHLREDSFWSRQRLDLSVYLYILYLFSHNISPETGSQMLPDGVHLHSIQTWYNFYRDIMTKSLLQAPIQLGGPGTIVEIDESKLGHKRKYNVGRMRPNSPWVFGLIQRGTGKVCHKSSTNEDTPEKHTTKN